ncbi:MAG TPA: AAA family ATPase [Thermoanaerobaculia bacterium]|jgi:hypothetical protein
MPNSLPFDAETIVRNRFAAAAIPIISIELRRYPEETIVIVNVAEEEVSSATELSNAVDRELQANGFDGFVTIRRAEMTAEVVAPLERGVGDIKATELANLLTARSRTSEIQPSLSYIRDAAQNIVTATTSRHHLIFGRRGAGKTALMVEAKRQIEQQGHLSSWTNLQTLRNEPAERVYLWIVRNVTDTLQAAYREHSRPDHFSAEVSALRNDVDALLGARRQATTASIADIAPRLQNVISKGTTALGVRLFVFLDDLHYTARDTQPLLLDLVHGSVRDSDAWLKVSAIKHLSRWFRPNPPLGLQTGHDAGHIDLDVTLENPSKAKAFLETVLKSYARHAGIGSLGNVFSSEALDRLVLASGAVPRDYLVLSAGAISQAQRRAKSRTVGVQDVNKSAGEAAAVKITELEDDVASAGVASQQMLAGLQRVREFCLDERRCTYFRIDFLDKESQPANYAVLQNLMDLRLIHLVNSGVSDERAAGRKSEVFMLDLSQFSGERLKKNLRILDFASGYLVVKEATKAIKIGSTPKQLLGLLRRGPLFALATLNNVAIEA